MDTFFRVRFVPYLKSGRKSGGQNMAGNVVNVSLRVYGVRHHKLEFIKIL